MLNGILNIIYVCVYMMKRGFQASEQKFNTTAALFFRALVWKIKHRALLNLIF